MASFSYKLRTLEGCLSKGIVVAKSLEEARLLFENRGLILIKLTPLKPWEKLLGKSELKPEELLSLFKNLAQLCRAGLTLLDALKSLESKKGAESYHSIIHFIEQGFPLSKSFEQSALISNELLISFLRQGENSGDYPKAFEQIVGHIQWLESLKKRLKKTLSYPLLVLGISISLMVFLLSFVVPQLLDLYSMSGLEVPTMTKALISFSNTMPLILFSLGVLILGGFFLGFIGLFFGRHTSFLLQKLLNLSLKTPLIGKHLRDILLLQYMQNMHEILKAKTKDILHGMSCSENAIQPQIYRNLFVRSRYLVEQGSSLSNALQKTFPMPQSVVKMIHMGEKSGDLPGALRHSTNYLDSHLQNSLEKVIQRLGPLMLLLVGGLLIFIISAVFLPLYSGLGGLDT